MAQHGLGHFEVGDDPVLHGPDGHDVAGGATEHALGLGTHRQDLVVAAVVALHGDNRGLAQHDPLALDIHAGVCGAKIDGQIVRKEPQNLIQNPGHIFPLLSCSVR
jgi:hypothetical protein